jgi:hypothetical protein
MKKEKELPNYQYPQIHHQLWYKANSEDVHRSTLYHKKLRELRHDNLENNLERIPSQIRMHLNVQEDDLVSILLLKK